MSKSIERESVSFVVYYKRQLGKGAFGIVFEGALMKKKKKIKRVAIKIIKFARQSVREATLKEIEVLKDLDHPYLIKFCGSLVAKGSEKAHIMMEFCDRGTLFDYFDMYNGIEERIAHGKELLYQVVEGVRYMHSKKYEHRDIKPSNILLKSVGDVDVAKLGDVGISRKFSDLKHYVSTLTAACTPAFAPSELLDYISMCRRKGPQHKMSVKLRGKIVPTKCDIWALGVTFIHVLAQKYSKVEHIGSENEPTIPKVFLIDDDLCDLLKQCLQFDPKKRISAEEILKHKFFDDIRGKERENREIAEIDISDGAFFSNRDDLRKVKSGGVDPWPSEVDKVVEKEPEKGEEVRYEIGELLAKGPHALVFNAKKYVNGIPTRVIAKRFVWQRFRDLIPNKHDAEMRVKWEKEICAHNIKMLKYLRHDNIIDIHSSVVKDEENIVYVERMTERTIGRCFKKEKKLEDRVKLGKKLFKEVLKGLKYLHAKEIASLSIKPGNLLVTKVYDELVCKIGVFNCAVKMKNGKYPKMNLSRTEAHVSGEFLAFEKLKRKLGANDHRVKKAFDELDPRKVDVYGMGVTMFRCLFNDSLPPRNDKATSEKIKEIGGDSDLMKIVEGCLKSNPDERWSVEEVLQHSFFSDGDPMKNFQTFRTNEFFTNNYSEYALTTQ